MAARRAFLNLTHPHAFGEGGGGVSREELLAVPLPVMVEQEGEGGGGNVTEEELEGVRAVGGGRVWSGEQVCLNRALTEP